MLTLLLDSCCNRIVLALIRDGQLIAERMPEPHHQAAQQLPILLRDCLSETQLTPKDIGQIVLGVGPGSYTGIRVGIALAQGISFALKTPIIQITSMKAWKPTREGPFMILFDAKSGGFYALEGALKRGKVTYSGNPALLSQEELLKRLSNHQIITPDETIRKRLPELFASKITVQGPDALYFSQQAEGLQASLDPLKPLYLRDSPIA